MVAAFESVLASVFLNEPRLGNVRPTRMLIMAILVRLEEKLILYYRFLITSKSSPRNGVSQIDLFEETMISIFSLFQNHQQSD